MSAAPDRRLYVGSSEIAALFGCSPYLTAWALYQQKRGALPPADLSDDVRVIAGQEMEAAIVRIMALLHGIGFRKVRRYCADVERRMGASLDYEAILPGWPACEVKNVDSLVWSREWLRDPERSPSHHEIIEDIEPPLHIDLQAQHQLAVTGKPYALLAVLVGGNRPYLLRRPRHEPTIAAIRERVAAFWHRVDAGDPPPVVGEDRAALAALYGQNNGLSEPLDLTGDNRFGALCEEIEGAKGFFAAAKKELAALEAELLDKLKGAECATDGEWWARWPVIHRKGYTVEPGTYRRLTITRRKEQAA